MVDADSLQRHCRPYQFETERIDEIMVTAPENASPAKTQPSWLARLSFQSLEKYEGVLRIVAAHLLAGLQLRTH